MPLNEPHKRHIERAALKAGALIMEYARGTKIYGEVVQKNDGTPVTIVDRMAEDIIVESLQGLNLGFPIIAEERFASHESQPLKGADSFWLIDALDGTKEFIAGSGEYTVNIALIKNGRPYYGLIYAPEIGELYCAQKEKGAFQYKVKTRGDVHEISDAPIKIHIRNPEKALTLVTSARQRTHTLNELYDDFYIAQRLRKGSSLKFCMIASGKADIYPRMGPTSEWDTAAADIILSEAGGVIIDLEANNKLTYGHEKRSFLNPYFAAMAQELYDGNPTYFEGMKARYKAARAKHAESLK